jgi:type I restriction enzyme S subunit
LDQIVSAVSEKSTSFCESGLPFLGLEHIPPGSLLIQGTGDSAVVKSEVNLFEHGDILYGKLRPYFRKSSIARFAGGCSTEILVLRPGKGFSRGFAFALISSSYFSELATSISTGTGLPRAQWNSMKSLKFGIPSHDVCEMLGDIADGINSLRYLHSKTNSLILEIINKLFCSWFIDFDPVKAKAEGKLPYGMDEETAAMFPSSFENSEHGFLPSGWRLGTLLDISKIWTGGTPKTSELSYWDGDIPWVSGADLSSSDLFAFESERKITSLGVDKSSTKVLPVGTVMITARGTVGATKITAVPMAMSQTSFGFKAKQGISDALVYSASQETIRQLRSYAYGAVFDTFTQSTIDITKIAIAPLEILQAFGKIVDPLFEHMKISAITQKNLACTRDALLPKMMSGELEVR